MNRIGDKLKDTNNVAENFKKIYGDLPEQIGINSKINTNNENSATSSKLAQRVNTVKTNLEKHEQDSELVVYLKSHLPRSDHKEIKDELKKTFALHKQKGGKIKKPQPKRKGKYLTAHERRNLGLNRLPKSGGLKVILYRPMI